MKYFKPISIITILLHNVYKIINKWCIQHICIFFIIIIIITKIECWPVFKQDPLLLTASQVSGEEGDSLLHFAGKCRSEAVGLFLTAKGAKVSVLNRAGETPLHCSCTTGVPQLTKALLQVSILSVVGDELVLCYENTFIAINIQVLLIFFWGTLFRKNFKN